MLKSDDSDVPIASVPTLYTVRDLTRILRISEAGIRRLIHTGALQAVRVGPVELRVRHEELQRFLDANIALGKAGVRDGRRRGRKPGPRPKTPAK